ncbi:hypothetical protein ACVWXL_006346 [Bradyrhizobium sp. GM22.5]
MPGIRSLLRGGLAPYSEHGEETCILRKIRQIPQGQGSEREGAEFQGVSPRRAADRAGVGRVAQSRDQSRRCRARIGHRTAAAAGQFARSPLRRRGRRASRAGLDAERVSAGQYEANAAAAANPQPPGARDAGFDEAPQANYGTAATIPTLDPELARQLGLPTEEDDAEALARPPRSKMEALGVKATADALESLIREGRPEFRKDDGSTRVWTPHRPPRPEKSEGGVRFEIKSHYEPRGDQPTAIAELVEGINRNDRSQVLLGVTGSGKTYTMAKVIEATQRPAIILAPEQDARRPALWRVQELLPRQRGRVFRQLLRLLPAGSVCPSHRHLHRKGLLDQRADRPHAPLGDARAARTRRRHHRCLGVLHLRYRLGRNLHRDDLCPEEGRAHRPAPADRRPRRAAVQAHPGRFYPRHISRARRCHRHLPGAL